MPGGSEYVGLFVRLTGQLYVMGMIAQSFEIGILAEGTDARTEILECLMIK